MTGEIAKLLHDAAQTAPPTKVDLTQAIGHGRALRKRRRRTRTAAALVLAAGTGLALTGLAPWEADPAMPAADDRGPVLLTALRELPLFQTPYSGVLRREGQCLLLDGRNGTDVVVWPRGSQWSATDKTVIYPDGTRIGVGNTVRAQAGYMPVDDTSLPKLLDTKSIEQANTCAKAHNAGIILFK